LDHPELRSRCEATLHEKQKPQKRLENIYQEPVTGRSPTGDIPERFSLPELLRSLSKNLDKNPQAEYILNVG
jgi:hypothetical protein